MLNNTILGGLGQVFGNLGAGVEYISPFSGNHQDDRYALMALGFNPDEAQHFAPDVDSWLSSLAKSSLEARNAIDDKLSEWRNDFVGDNPSYGTQLAEGVGSSLGFMAGGKGAAALAGLAGAGPVGMLIAGALAVGGLEALSESGGLLGDAYRDEKYNEGLSAANKSFLSNAGLNTGLDLAGGFFSPLTRGIRNPLTKFAANTAGQIINEIVQEPSQQTIEKAARDSIYNGSNFLPALGDRVSEWPQDFANLAPSVAGSSLITSLLMGGAGLANPNIRQQVKDEWRNRMYDPKQTADELKSQLDARQKLINQLQREKSTVKDEARIKQYETDIANADNLIATLQDRLKPGNLDYSPNPYDEFSGKVSRVTARAGEKPINTAFSLIEADDIITSHNDDFTLNRNYNQANQNRDRGKLEAQNNVFHMADTLDPTLLGDNPLAQNGAPILDAHNQTISGNGRVLAIRRAYSQNPEKAKLYRQYIIDNAQTFGVDPDLAARMKHPVLVRSILDGQDFDISDFAKKANESTVEQLGAGNIAQNDADLISKNNLLKDFDPDKSIGEQSDLLYAFASNLPPNEQNNLFSEGKPTFDAQKRFLNAITAVAYPRKELLTRFTEAADNDSKNILQQLLAAAPYIANIQYNAGQDEAMRKELIIGDDVAVAALWLERFRKNATKDITVQQQIDQAEFQDNGLSVIEEHNRLTPERKLILQFLYDNIQNKKNIATGLFNYAQIAGEQKNSRQVHMFPDANPKLDKISILRRAFGLDNQMATETKTSQNQQINTHNEQIPQAQAQQTTQDEQSQQLNLINPQSSPAVKNRFWDESPSENQQVKSAPDYADDIDSRNLHPVSFPRNSQEVKPDYMQDAENNSEVFNTEQNQVISHDPTQQQRNLQPVQGKFSTQNFIQNAQLDNNEILRTQQQVNPARNNDFQGQGNFEDDSGNRKQTENSRTQGDIEAEKGNIQPISGRFDIPNFLNSEHLQDQNNDTVQSKNDFNQSTNNQQQGNNLQQVLDSRKKADNHFRSFQDELKKQLRKGGTAVRNLFYRFGDKEAPANPQKSSFDAKLTAYDGYIGDFQTGIGDNSAVSHAFFDLQDGQPFVGLTDQNGNFVATYDVRNNHFYINEGYEHSDLSRRIQDDFFRAFGKNPTEELLRRWFMHKAINARENPLVADASSRVYIANNEYFAHSSEQSLLDLVLADNLSIEASNDNTNDRGNTTFIPQRKNQSGNVIQEARTLVRLYRNSDASSLIHETAHIFTEKFKNLDVAGFLKNGSQAWRDWGTIKREYGLLDIDFSKPLSKKDMAKWINAQEQIAAGFEKYFWKELAPKGLSAKMRDVFNHFKEWIRNIYRNLTDISYTDAKGRKHNDFAPSENVKAIFDRLLKGSNNFAITESNSQFSTLNSNQGIESFSQSDKNNGGFFGWLKRFGKHLIHPFYSIAHVIHKPSTVDAIAPFPNPETERRFTEAGKTIPRQGVLRRISQAFKEATKSVIGGDYSDITNSPRIGDKELNLNGALQSLRNLERNKKYALNMGKKQILDLLKTLNPQQYELFNRLRVLQDLDWQIKVMPDSALPFELTPDDVLKALKQYSDIAHQRGNEAVLKAIEDEERNMRDTNDTYTRYAGILGLNMDGVLRNPHYYRHRIIQFAHALSMGNNNLVSSGNIDVQDTVNELLNDTQTRSWLKKRKGSKLDFITNYFEANTEVRIQMLQDIETMKTLLEIKKNFDIAPRIRKKFNLPNIQENTDIQGAESFSQSGDREQESILDHIPDGHEAFDLNGWGGIEGNKSVPDNLLNMAVSKIAEQHGVPIDSVFESLGIADAGNNIMVIPAEVAASLRKIAKSRQRGALAQAAKNLTTWWKKSVLFTPTRNLLYNIRNFSGDLDAVIAGNPSALKFLPQAVKELTGFYTQHDKEGYEASQDLMDYIKLSGTLGIPSLNLSSAQAKSLVDLLTASDSDKMKKLGEKRKTALIQRINENAAHEPDVSSIKKAWRSKWNLLRQLFDTEHNFTEWREHLLRFAAYLDYKQQIENNKDGRPNNWGASIEDEVMAVNDIKERAFKMSNELLGAYDQVSELGKQLRDMLIPFYSWMEVNMRRSWRLLRNGFKYGKGREAVQKYLTGKLYTMPLYAVPAAYSLSKLLLFTGALQMFNRFWAPDADDDLPNDVKYRPHLTFGKRNGRVYYFDRIGAIADALDWFSLDSAWLDGKDIANGQQTLGGYFKKMIQAPFSKAINGLNPGIRMPIELAMGRSTFPDAFNPSTIRDPAEYVARSFGLAWPYKAITGKPHSNLQELSHLFVYSQDADEAAYWQTLDRVRQFQNTVLDKHFDGFASTARGRILQNIKKALRYNDKQSLRKFMREYSQADGTKQGLKASMKAMNPLHGLSEKEKAQFMHWISPDDRKYLRKAMRYFHQLADRFIQ